MWHRWSRLLAAPGWSGGHGGAWCARSAGCTVPAMWFGSADTGNDAKGRRRMVLVPATMELGERNWWFPSWVDRVAPRLSIERTRAEA